MLTAVFQQRHGRLAHRLPTHLHAAASDRHDHFAAAQLRNRARRRGVQVGTIDAILAQLCVRYELRLLTTDADFTGIAEHESLECWAP